MTCIIEPIIKETHLFIPVCLVNYVNKDKCLKTSSDYHSYPNTMHIAAQHPINQFSIKMN